MKPLTRFATWLYRWTMAIGIIGVAFSAMTFVGVWAILLSPWLSSVGFTQSTTILFLMSAVFVVVLGLGFVLDRIQLWKSQALVGTVRNPFLVTRLYEKEWLGLVTMHLPLLRSNRAILAEGIMSPDRRREIERLDVAIARVEETIQKKEWTLREGEDIYADAR
mgnify:CR=1 FL=1